MPFALLYPHSVLAHQHPPARLIAPASFPHHSIRALRGKAEQCRPRAARAGASPAKPLLPLHPRCLQLYFLLPIRSEGACARVKRQFCSVPCDQRRSARTSVFSYWQPNVRTAGANTLRTCLSLWKDRALYPKIYQRIEIGLEEKKDERCVPFQWHFF